MKIYILAKKFDLIIKDALLLIYDIIKVNIYYDLIELNDGNLNLKIDFY